jgi:hypothetical protein
VRYVGFDIPNEFMVGYGLDYPERYREMPCVGCSSHRVHRSSDVSTRKREHWYTKNQIAQLQDPVGKVKR